MANKNYNGMHEHFRTQKYSVLTATTRLCTDFNYLPLTKYVIRILSRELICALIFFHFLFYFIYFTGYPFENNNIYILIN